MTDQGENIAGEFDEAIRELSRGKYQLKLYVAGNTEKSARAIAQIHEICETNLKGRYKLEVIDIYQQPELARGEQIIATPTLIKMLPPPLKRIIGDFSRMDRILIGLDIIALDDPLKR